MREIFSFLFDRLTDPLGLPIDWWKEYIILTIIGVCAYVFAFRVVGDMYSIGIIEGKVAGSIVHWVIRFIFFVTVWAVTYFVIGLAKLIFTYWVPVVCVLGGILVIGAITIIVVRHKKEGRRDV